MSGPEYRHIGPGGLSVVCRYDNRRGAEVGERWAERAAWVIAAFSWSRASEVAPTPASRPTLGRRRRVFRRCPAWVTPATRRRWDFLGCADSIPSSTAWPADSSRAVSRPSDGPDSVGAFTTEGAGHRRPNSTGCSRFDSPASNWEFRSQNDRTATEILERVKRSTSRPNCFAVDQARSSLVRRGRYTP